MRGVVSDILMWSLGGSHGSSCQIIQNSRMTGHSPVIASAVLNRYLLIARPDTKHSFPKSALDFKCVL